MHLICGMNMDNFTFSTGDLDVAAGVYLTGQSALQNSIITVPQSQVGSSKTFLSYAPVTPKLTPMNPKLSSVTPKWTDILLDPRQSSVPSLKLIILKRFGFYHIM